MHNFYLDFLKSFKKFMASTFPDIEHYQFNYSDKSFLNYKLYQEHVKEFPMCHISLTDIRVDDNRAFFRQIGQAFCEDTLQPLCANHTKMSSVIMDFKWVILTMQVKINLNSPSDLFNYHNTALSTFPKNMMFYSYDYGSYIDVNKQVQDWDIDDETEGLYYRANDQDIKGFALYYNSPIFKINSMTKNKQIDGESNLDLDIEVQLKVPNVIGTKTIKNQIIDGIQIIINQTGYSDLPILIDLNNDIYSDRRKKMKRMYILEKSDFDIETNTLKLPISLLPALTNVNIGVYQVSDSTLDVPTIFWHEQGLLTDANIFPDRIEIQLTDELINFNFSPFSVLELLIFSI